MIERLTPRLLAIVVAFSLFVWIPSASAADATDDAAKALEKLDEDWSNAATTRDAGKIAAFYAHDAITCLPNSPMLFGREKTQEFWALFFKDDTTLTISWLTVHAELSKSGDLGSTIGLYKIERKARDGKMVTDVGTHLCVWKKQSDGTWKAIHDMWNTDAK